MLLHHNTHVHTFVGGTGTSGSFVAENHGPIGTFSYEIILTATDSSGLQSSTSVNVAVAGDTSPPTAPTALTATAQGRGRVSLAWRRRRTTSRSPATGSSVPGRRLHELREVATPAGTSYSDTG